jgi:hypothetical protein
MSSLDSGSTGIYVEKLETKEQWPTWESSMKRYLIVKRLGHLLEKPRIRPGEQDIDFLARETLWHSDNSIGVAYIQNFCYTNLERQLIDAKSVLDYLEILAKAMKPIGSGAYRRLHKEFKSLTLADCRDVGHYGQELRRIWNKINRIHKSATIPEAWVVTEFQDGLGPAFNTFLSAFMLTNITVEQDDARNVTNLADMISRAQEFDQQMNTSNTAMASVQAAGKQRLRCQHCGKNHSGIC